MGVTGLKTFIDNNASQFLLPIQLHDTKLVIDGSNLMFELYFRSSAATKDYIFGGDLAWFAGECRLFFDQLIQCDVKPIVVFDGAVCSSDKLGTLLVRAKNSLTRAKSISTKKSFKGKVLPKLTSLAMFIVMNELSVEFVQSTGEADQEIATIANQFECPVLSNDSDFFIFDLKGGLISIDSFDRTYKTKRIITENGNSYQYADCLLYHVNELVARFSGLEKDVLPLFSCLIGNDYVSSINKINRIEQQTLTQSNGLRVDQQHEQIFSLLNWMRNKTAEEVIELFKMDRTKKGEQRIRLSVDTYDIDEESELSKHLSMVSPSKSDDSAEDSDLPAWFVKEYNTGKHLSWLMDVVIYKRHLPHTNIENFSWPSPHQFTSSLRRIMYGLLRTDDEDTATIEEYDRVEDQYAKLPPAQPTLYLNGKKLPNLHQLRQLSMDQRIALMLEILKTKPGFTNEINKPLSILNKNLARLDPLRFIILAIKYWLNETDVPVWIEFVYALIINLLLGAHIDRSINPRFFKYSIVQEETKRAVYKLMSFWNTRKTGFQLFKNKNIDQFDPSIVHFLSQFKVCLQIIISLNSLLEFPFDVSKFPFYFMNGTFLYNLTFKLKSIQDLNCYLKNLTGPNYCDVIEKIIFVLVNGLNASQVKLRDNWKKNFKETTRKTTENKTRQNKEVATKSTQRNAKDKSFKNRFSELAL